MKTETKIKKLQVEIDAYQSMLDDRSVPADEKKQAREEIAELEKKIEKLKAPDKKPAKAQKSTGKGKKHADSTKVKKEVDDALADCREKIAASKPPRQKPVQHQAGTRLSDAVEKVWNIIESEAGDDAATLKKGKKLCADFQHDVQQLLDMKPAVNKDVNEKAKLAIAGAEEK